MSLFDAASHPRQPFDHHHHLKRKVDDHDDQDHSFPLLKMARPSSPPFSFPSPCLTSALAAFDVEESKTRLSSSHPPPPFASPSASLPLPSSLASPPSDELHFFVRLLSHGSLVVHARPTDTVNSIIERIESVTGIPSREQRLIYCGRQLCGESTLRHSAVKKDATLQLTGRLRSTGQSRAWRVVDDLVSSICFLNAAAASDIRTIDRQRTVAQLVKDFLNTTLADSDGDKDKALAYLGVFSLAGAPSELVKLYLSPLADNRAIAEGAIRIFLDSNPDFLPEYMHSQCAPIVFTFCRMLAATVGRNDQLYVGCRRTLSKLLKASIEPLNSVHLKSTHLLLELHLFITELSGLVDAALSSDSMLDSEVVLTDLSNFLTAMRWAIQEWKGVDRPISEHLYILGSPRYENGIGLLYELYIKLLNKVGQCLKKVEDILDERGQARYEAQLAKWSQLLVVLTVIKVFSKIFEGAEQLLHSLLFERRRTLNALLRCAKRNRKLRWFLKYKDITDFEARRNLLLMMLPEGKEEEELHEMLIDRFQLLSESFQYIGQADATALRGAIFMEFKNEEATGPGVLREWFCLLCQAIFNPQNPLFLSCPHDHRRFFPNPASSVDPLHLKYFSFSGRVIALALMHKVQVGVVFDRMFFLQLAGRSVTLEDVRDADPVLYMSCKQILEMDAALLDSDALGLTFAREIDMMGSKRMVELCPGGKDIIVHSRNREEYVSLLIKHCFVTSISEQVSHFAEGFGDILSNSKHQQFFFDSMDLEDFDRMLGGSNNVINVKDWKEHTEYNGYKSKDRQIYWFWKVVESMSEEQRRVLLFFWTSIKYLPVDGFGGLASRLYIYKSSSDSQECLPTSHTCFYRLCLPAYGTKSMMHDRLQLISQEHISCSFGTS
ncbi:HECT-domain (ubiquitin-transferase) [Musa troglodytarum]|uniref:HECT-type E3 ubiquitin transferase n=1 Tax=Musa troglodytarum TaxID=320322 RepID=A0A9E7FCT3_9LILI|nr:HECT-domain (ubiquitin-transferase) [Musa troglodytarum]